MQISPHDMEIETIYSHIHAESYRSITITSAHPGEGVSTVAASLAQRNILAGYSTLLVDLNLYKPSLVESLAISNVKNTQDVIAPPALVNILGGNVSLIGVTAPNNRAGIVKLRRKEILSEYLNQWYAQFDTVIFDTSSLNKFNSGNIPAEQVAAVSDATILVVLAGQTKEPAIESAVEKLQRANTNLIGCVINDRDNPSLKLEMLRETSRLAPCFNRLSRLFCSWINRSDFLAFDI